MGMGKVRMADIAAKVGVSTVTVHNALAGNKGVSDEMREKIQKVADELGYHQMTAAAKRERNKGGLRNIGVIISEKYLAAYTTFYWKMYQELALVATDKNCMAAVEILKQDMEAGKSALSALTPKRKVMQDINVEPETGGAWRKRQAEIRENRRNNR